MKNAIYSYVMLQNLPVCDFINLDSCSLPGVCPTARWTFINKGLSDMNQHVNVAVCIKQAVPAIKTQYERTCFTLDEVCLSPVFSSQSLNFCFNCFKYYW